MIPAPEVSLRDVHKAIQFSLLNLMVYQGSEDHIPEAYNACVFSPIHLSRSVFPVPPYTCTTYLVLAGTRTLPAPPVHQMAPGGLIVDVILKLCF